MNYSRLKRKYKKMSTLKINKDKEVISNIDYNKQYIFKITKRQYPKLIIDAVFLTALFGLMLVAFIIALLNCSEQADIYFSIVAIFFVSFILFIMVLGTYKQYKKYPAIVLKFSKGEIYYHDGTQPYQFNVKSICSLSFDKSYSRSNRWIISINLSGSLDRIKIDVLKMNDPEILYRLLTNFNKKIRVY